MSLNALFPLQKSKTVTSNVTTPTSTKKASSPIRGQTQLIHYNPGGGNQQQRQTTVVISTDNACSSATNPIVTQTAQRVANMNDISRSSDSASRAQVQGNLNTLNPIALQSGGVGESGMKHTTAAVIVNEDHHSPVTLAGTTVVNILNSQGESFNSEAAGYKVLNSNSRTSPSTNTEIPLQPAGAANGASATGSNPEDPQQQVKISNL